MVNDLVPKEHGTRETSSGAQCPNHKDWTNSMCMFENRLQSQCVWEEEVAPRVVENPPRPLGRATVFLEQKTISLRNLLVNFLIFPDPRL